MRAYVVHVNGDTGLDVAAPDGLGAIESRYGIGWGCYPATPHGLAEALAECVRRDEQTRAFFNGRLPDGLAARLLHVRVTEDYPREDLDVLSEVDR